MGANITFWWFIIMLGLFVLTSVSAIIRRLPKYRNYILSLPKDKMATIVSSYSLVIKIHKSIFYMVPLCLFIFPYILYIYLPGHDFFYGTAAVIMMYISLVEDFMFKKTMLNEIQKREVD